jgi:hypothetical protein
MKNKINGYKILFLFFFCFCFNQVYSNVLYQYNNPSFSIEILHNWVVDRTTILPGRYDKFVKKNDKQSVLSIKRDIYSYEVDDVWSLDESNFKKELEIGQNIDDFNFKKIKINDNHAVRSEFKLALNFGGAIKNYKCSMYKMLFIENNVEYVIHFYLLSDSSEFLRSDEDVLKMITSIKSKKSDQDFFKLVEFNNYKFKIPSLKNYSYFSDIQMDNPLSNKFNPENINLTGVVSFEYLIADSLGVDPLIHIYSNEMFRNKKISKVDFNEAKIFWKGIYKKNNFKIVTDLIKKDSASIFSEISRMNVDLTPSLASNLIDENNLLSTLVILENGTTPNQDRQIFITNYIYIKEIVVFIKLSKSFIKYSDILKLEKLSIDIVDEFLKINN